MSPDEAAVVRSKMLVGALAGSFGVRNNANDLFELAEVILARGHRQHADPSQAITLPRRFPAAAAV